MISVLSIQHILHTEKNSLHCDSEIFDTDGYWIHNKHFLSQLAQSHEKQDLFLASYFALIFFLCCIVFVEHKCSVLKLDCHTVCSCLDIQKEMWLCALVAGKCKFQMGWNTIAMFKYNVRKPE